MLDSVGPPSGALFSEPLFGSRFSDFITGILREKVASQDAVIIPGASPFIMHLVKMPCRKDAHTPEKPV